jgi:4-deoxy-L-threo-5-hexosulose-uronate ketol-isomerase
MATFFETRYASSPKAVKKYDTQELRDEFLIPDLMESGKINLPTRIMTDILRVAQYLN